DEGLGTHHRPPPEHEPQHDDAPQTRREARRSRVHVEPIARPKRRARPWFRRSRRSRWSSPSDTCIGGRTRIRETPDRETLESDRLPEVGDVLEGIGTEHEAVRY